MKLYKIDIENETFATKKPKMVDKVAIICFSAQNRRTFAASTKKKKTKHVSRGDVSINQTKKTTSYENQGNH